MPLTTGTLDSLATHFAGLATHLALHTADPGATGINQSAAARVAAGWGTASNGVVTATNKAFTGGAASGPVTHIGYWSAATGGTFRGSRALSGDTSFNAAGEYTVTSVSETGTSTGS
jgi:hypothetical protein